MSKAFEKSFKLCLKLLKNYLNYSQLYFSYTYDLTNSYQKNISMEYFTWDTSCSKFFWNNYLISELQQASIKDYRMNWFIQPVIQGFCKAILSGFNGRRLSVALISTMSIYMAGIPDFKNGIDKKCNV